jgi:Tfp pilus assembly ATPase PilU
MDVDQDLYPLKTKTEIKTEEIVESDSSSSTEELNLFINKERDETETHQPAEILETDSEIVLSSDSSFEASKKRKT